ncbi:hypothetical protein [Nesterenkonia haasae]|uniref:hypothetical protein n=1 Tax=Nesterenkonia haasae TaxID=2587813 RepID=UPI001391B778|nr:hypothetical protein [Nesterenkonia haasae]NDK31079.1 hypothetical protein [Nesterenkonia haasae]
MSNPPQDNHSQWGPASEHGASQPGGENPYAGHNPSKFGTEAYDPNAYGGPLEQPDKFRKLKMFTLVSLAIFVINQLVSFVMMSSSEYRNEMIDEIEQQMSATGQTVDRGQIETYVDAVVGVGVAIALIGLALYLLVYFGLRANKNWARIVGIIFAILGAVISLGGFAFGGATDIVTIVVTLLWVGVNIYWLILAFSPDVTRYLREAKR